eukprot:2828320-Pyramimonas_sp.AAC.1
MSYLRRCSGSLSTSYAERDGSRQHPREGWLAPRRVSASASVATVRSKRVLGRMPAVWCVSSERRSVG